MTFRLFGLGMVLAVLSGCGHQQVKSQQNTAQLIPSYENSVAEVDMIEFGYRNY